MNAKLILSATALALLGACANNLPARLETSYEEAAANKFVVANRDAINKLVAGFSLGPSSDTPVLVATIVNVNDMRRSAPLGRTLSEQYASHMVNAGFNVKEMKLRGDVFVKEDTGELLLSREIKDIAQSHHANYVLVGTYSVAASTCSTPTSGPFKGALSTKASSTSTRGAMKRAVGMSSTWPGVQVNSMSSSSVP